MSNGEPTDNGKGSEVKREEIFTRMKSTLVIAAAIIVAVRLARDPDISRPSLRLTAVVSESVSLARMPWIAWPDRNAVDSIYVWKVLAENRQSADRRVASSVYRMGQLMQAPGKVMACSSFPSAPKITSGRCL